MSDRRQRLRSVLDALMTGGPSPHPDPTSAWELALAAFLAHFRLSHGAATAHAEAALDALPADADAVTRAVAYAARALAASGGLARGGWTDIASGRTPTGDPLADALPLLEQLGTGEEAEFARYLLAEAALACARVGFAAALPMPDPAGFLAVAGRAHPFQVVMVVLVARVAAFHGRIREAQAALEEAEGGSPLGELLLEATRSFLQGNAGDPRGARALAARIDSEVPRRVDRLAQGCLLLAAFGLIAFSEARPAAALVLGAGGGARLELFVVTDRVLSFEMLVNAALEDGDPDAADAWAALAEELAESPIADAAVHRVRARVRLAAGDAVGAEEAARAAGERARAEGRRIEASEADILVARAVRAKRRDGAQVSEERRRLQQLAAEGERLGHRALVRAASVELRAGGRRLRPFAGSEWQGLSEREREVGHLLLEGLTNGEIAARLYLSPHTVRVHVSRVLAAFGAASRFALAARMPREAPSAGPAELTARQRAVVAELATGASNAEIAARLGISAKTVEKHLHEASRRLGVTTRVGILRATRLAPDAAG